MKSVCDRVKQVQRLSDKLLKNLTDETGETGETAKN